MSVTAFNRSRERIKKEEAKLKAKKEAATKKEAIKKTKNSYF